MKITIESTSKIVEFEPMPARKTIAARVWQGHTDSGVPVQCFIAVISPEIEESHPDIEKLTAQFEAELIRQAKPRPTVDAIPLRMVI